MRDSRDAQLAVPKLIVPSVQCNIRAGRFPEPDENLGFGEIGVDLEKLGSK